ncbi:MAG: aldo/keto reductase [Akkermansia sp.]
MSDTRRAWDYRVDMNYSANENRYTILPYRRCGHSGLLLPALSLGLWHNFGTFDDEATSRAMLRLAFDAGITHFDLANNYGPPAGSAEERFGKLFHEDLRAYRDELVISTKASHLMWAGPYGDWGSRKHLLASLDQSLKRMRLDYVDIFYAHRYDAETPLEETMGALITAVKSGRALYAGISKFPPDAAKRACAILRSAGVPCLIHQVRYNMMDRAVEQSAFSTVMNEGMGCIAFSPLAQGMLTNRYLHGIPQDSRAAGRSVFLNENRVQEHMSQVSHLIPIAERRGQSLAQMAIAWVLKRPEMTSCIIGASRPAQITECLGALKHPNFSEEELREIDAIFAQ